ncbi:MAG TPA: ABC transporter permease, partial [Bacteroidia bacterium]|nr:ABC transporter permease [Bacteroidia bacterium]
IIIPLLTVFSDIISLYACYVGVNARHNEPISFRLFTTQVLEELRYSDVVPSIIKSVIFGFTIGIIGCYKGYYSSKGAEGVGKSVNASVVICIFAIFIIDLLVTQIADILNFT